MSRYIAISVLVLFLSGCALSPRVNLSQEPERPKINVKIGAALLKVELALTIEQQTKGLSGRESLAPDTGMLFKFSKADRYNFWMKDMKFALDFIWFKDSKVVQLNANIPPPAKDSPQPEILQAGEPIDMVIEVPAGWIRKHDLKLGEIITGD